MNRWAAVVLWILAGYLAYVAVSMVVLIVYPMFSEPWVGPEPEYMIPLVPAALATGFIWLGRRLWRRTPAPRN